MLRKKMPVTLAAMSLLNVIACSAGAFSTIVEKESPAQSALEPSISADAKTDILDTSDTLFIEEASEVPAIAQDTGEPITLASGAEQKAVSENDTAAEEKGPIYRPVNEAAAPKYGTVNKVD